MSQHLSVSVLGRPEVNRIKISPVLCSFISRQGSRGPSVCVGPRRRKKERENGGT